MEIARPQQEQIICELFIIVQLYCDIKLEIVQKNRSFCATSYRRKKSDSKPLFMSF